MPQSMQSGNTDSKPVRRRFIDRFVKDRRGSTAIEFALLAMPFSMLVFAILESSLSFAAQQVMANSVEDLSRDLRTGTLKPADATAAAVKARICGDLSVLVSGGCPGLDVDLKNYAQFADVPVTIPYGGATGINTAGFAITPGGPDTINQLRVFYRWPTYTNLVGSMMSNLPGNNMLLFATLTWQNEHFQI